MNHLNICEWWYTLCPYVFRINACLPSVSLQTGILNPGFMLQSLEELWKHTYVWVLFQNVLCRLLMGGVQAKMYLYSSPGITVHKVETLLLQSRLCFPQLHLPRTHRAGLSPLGFSLNVKASLARRSELTAAHSVCQLTAWFLELEN